MNMNNFASVQAAREKAQGRFELTRCSFYHASIEVTKMAQVEFKLLLPDSLAREAGSQWAFDSRVNRGLTPQRTCASQARQSVV
jgi:hypothetical protein